MGIIIKKPQRLEAKRMYENLETERKIIKPKFQRPKNLEKRKPFDINFAFNRISELWELDLGFILPDRETEEQKSSLFGQTNSSNYNPKTHKIIFDSRKQLAKELALFRALINLIGHKNFRTGPIINKEPTQFEYELMGVNNKHTQLKLLLNETSTLFSEDRKSSKFTNHNLNTAYAGISALFLAYFGRLPNIDITDHITLTLLTLTAISSAKSMAKITDANLLRKQIQNLYDFHGEDGLILYMIFPPRVIGTIETLSWNKRMVSLELLEPNGGLTLRGIEFIKKVLPREQILKRLKQMKANRKK